MQIQVWIKHDTMIELQNRCVGNETIPQVAGRMIREHIMMTKPVAASDDLFED
jgi:hypothetical protein